MDAGFWKNKSVFITGHTGFKGSWICKLLLKFQAKITGFSLAPKTSPSLFKELQLDKQMFSVIADIRDQSQMNKVLIDSNPEIIFHLAAQPIVITSYEDPVNTYNTNVMGTVHLLNSARNCTQLRSIVIVTSDKCYKNLETVDGYKEEDKLGGYDPYSNSKACAELVTQSMRDSFFPQDKIDKHRVAVASARAGNVIGGGDWADYRIIPDLVRAFAKNEVATIRSPEAVRPWQHVLDPIRGYVSLAEKLYQNPKEFVGAWNFGPTENIFYNISQIAEIFAKEWERESGINAKFESKINLDASYEAHLLRLNAEKAQTKLSWNPLWNQEEAILRTANWYSKFYSKSATADELTEYDLKIIS